MEVSQSYENKLVRKLNVINDEGELLYEKKIKDNDLIQDIVFINDSALITLTANIELIEHNFINKKSFLKSKLIRKGIFSDLKLVNKISYNKSGLLLWLSKRINNREREIYLLHVKNYTLFNIISLKNDLKLTDVRRIKVPVYNENLGLDIYTTNLKIEYKVLTK